MTPPEPSLQDKTSDFISRTNSLDHIVLTWIFKPILEIMLNLFSVLENKTLKMPQFLFLDPLPGLLIAYAKKPCRTFLVLLLKNSLLSEPCHFSLDPHNGL